MKGKPWSVEEEKELKKLVEAKSSLPVIAEKLHKPSEAVRQKIRRLGLEVVEQGKKNARTTTSSVGLKLPADLDSVEETLLMLSGALTSLRKGGLDKVEILRLRGIISGCKIYKELLVDYMDYRGLEVELLDLRGKYAELVKKASNIAAK